MSKTPLRQDLYILSGCILNLEEIASLISILNSLMDEQQSFSRHVTPTTICGEKNRSELGVESETPEMTGSIPLCIMVHGMGGSDAWSLLFSRSFAVFFPSCFVLCFYWLCFLMYLLHFFNRESMVVIRQSTALQGRRLANVGRNSEPALPGLGPMALAEAASCLQLHGEGLARVVQDGRSRNLRGGPRDASQFSRNGGSLDGKNLQFSYESKFYYLLYWAEL